MSSAPFCRVCLASNRKINCIDNIELRKIFEKLKGTEAVTHGTDTMCYICYSQLQRCRTFYDMVHRSEEILKDLFDKGFEVTQETLDMLNIKTVHNLSLSPVKYLSTDNHNCTTEVYLTVKLENERTVDDDDVRIEGTDVISHLSDLDTEEISEDRKPLKIEGSNIPKLKELKTVSVQTKPMRCVLRKKPYACSICNRAFSFKYYLKKHINNHTSTRFACKKCFKTFTSNRLLNQHRKTCNNKSVSCEICRMTFCNKYLLEEHRSTHTIEKLFSCDICTDAFTEKNNLKEHMKFHARENFACNDCVKIFSQESALGIHKLVAHSGDKPGAKVPVYPCITCGKSFNRWNNLQIHMRIHSAEKPYDNNTKLQTQTQYDTMQTQCVTMQTQCDTMKTQCDTMKTQCEECHKTFDGSVALKNHMKTHTNVTPHVCTQCSKSFSRSIYLQKHILTHAEVKEYTCSQCVKTYRSKNSLHRHVKTHSGKTYIHTCDRCAKGFIDNSDLKKHMLMHTGERLFPCQQCDKAFARKYQYHEHMRVHTGEKPYACNECDKKFTQSSSLNLHKRIHTGLKPFICTLCDKAFPDKYRLRKHVRIHTGEKPNACDKCPQRFTCSNYLHDHDRRVHTKDNVTCDTCYKNFTGNVQLKRHMKIHGTNIGGKHK